MLYNEYTCVVTQCPIYYFSITISGIKYCQKCDIYCLFCSGVSSNCTSCNTTWLNGTTTVPVYTVQGQNTCVIICSSTYLLFGTVCVSSCPTGYGPDATSTNCIPCDQYCSSCSILATNCTACYSTINISSVITPIYKLYNEYTCVVTQCPIAYFPITILGIKYCQKCDIYCLVCSGVSSNCTSCYTTGLNGSTTVPVYTVQGQNTCVIVCQSTYLLYGTVCVPNCPSGYGPDTTSTNCIICDVYCSACSMLSTNCTTCFSSALISSVSTSIYMVFNQFTCVLQFCPTAYFPTTIQGIKYCKKCNIYCLVCSVVSSNCTSCYTTGLNGTTTVPVYTVQGQNTCVIICPTTWILFSTMCVPSCPAGYGPDAASFSCIACDIYCSSCSILSTNCTKCYSTVNISSIINPVYMLFNEYTCVITQCPTAYFPITVLGVKYCKKCDAYCLVCLGTSNNCISCYTSGLNGTVTVPVYTVQGQNTCVIACPTTWILFGTVCVPFCPPGYGPDAASFSCIACDIYCSSCSVISTNCTACYPTANVSSVQTIIYMIFNEFRCVPSQCPAAYYSLLISGHDYCKKCDILCSNCSGNALNCSLCQASTSTGTQIFKVQNYLSCVTTCPSGFFTYSSTSQCLSCALHCTTLSLSSFLVNNGATLQFIFNFSLPIDFSTFSYLDFVFFTINDPQLSLTSNFTISFIQSASNQFRIDLQTIGTIDFQNLMICANTKSQTNTLLQYALNGYPMASSVYLQQNCYMWTLPLQFTLFQKEQIKIFSALQNVNILYQDFKTRQGIQEIFKSGIFSLLAPGAQLSSTILLHNTVLSRNLYEGSRFWGSFVYFDVPQFQKSSQKTKYILNQPEYNLLQKNKVRLLQIAQAQYIKEFRFERTGHTGFFIYDTYLQLSLILFCWILYFIGRYYQKKVHYTSKQRAYKISSKINAVIHKIHQMSFFYLILAAITQYRNFQPTTMHFVSVILSFIFLGYFLSYQLKIYYDLLQYPLIKVKTHAFQKIVKRYAFFLAYYRFQEYKDTKYWSIRHFLRPYNYHTLSFIKKACMLISIPMFYEEPRVSIQILMILQILEVIHFILTYPYQDKWRNINYFVLQLLLMQFFILSYVNQILAQQIYDSNNVQIINLEPRQIYKTIGWIGVIVLYLYNIIYLISSLVQFLIIIFSKDSLQKKVWRNRQQYYLKLFDHFQQYGSYYRLVKNYTQELQYNLQRKQGLNSKYLEFVNRLHQAHPITDLSDQKYKVFKNIVDRGDLMDISDQQGQQLNDKNNKNGEKYKYKNKNYDKEGDNSMRRIKDQQFNEEKQFVQIKIQVFKIYNIRKKLLINTQDSYYNQTNNIYERFKPETKAKMSFKNNQYARKTKQNLSSGKLKDYSIHHFQIDYNIVTQLFKAVKQKNITKYQNKHQIKIGQRIKNKIKSQQLNIQYIKQLNNTILKYKQEGTIQIKLTTYLKIKLSQYQQGQMIKYSRDNMRQQIQFKILQNNGCTKTQKRKLNKLIDGFPIDWDNLIKMGKNHHVLFSQMNQYNNFSNSNHAESLTKAYLKNLNQFQNQIEFQANNKKKEKDVSDQQTATNNQSKFNEKIQFKQKQQRNRYKRIQKQKKIALKSRLQQQAKLVDQLKNKNNNNKGKQTQTLNKVNQFIEELNRIKKQMNQ